VRKSFVGSAVILMIAGLVARLLGFVYRICLSNLAGAEGIGLYELVVPVYTAIVLTITSGITIAVSKMTAERNARMDNVNPRRITVCALALTAAAGMLVSLLISLDPEFLSEKMLGDPRTHDALVVLVPCLPAVVAASALKGYFYGMQNVIPTAFSQTAEQTLKIVILFIASGRIAESGPEYACTIAVFSAAAGEILNMLILFLVFALRKKAGEKANRRPMIMGRRSITKELLKAAVPVSANRLVISALSAAEFILIPVMLASGGLDEKSSMETFGRLTGMALPLIMFPSVVTNSIATTLVPAISESVALKRNKALNYQISKSIQITFILGMIFTAMFFSFSNEIGALLYRREKIGDLLFLLSFSCVFIYLQQTLTGVLNGLGKQSILLRNTIIGSVLRIAVVCVLIPMSGIRIYILGMTASLVLTECLNLAAIYRATGLVPDMKGWILKPGLAGILSILCARYVHYFFDIFGMGTMVTTLLTLGTNVLITSSLMIIIGVISLDEIKNLIGLKN
jgi:stage V sporulation protein B